MEKLHSNITQCLKFITEDCKSYSTAVDEGLSHVKLLVAHLTTLKKIKDSYIEDTCFYEIDPDAKRKLQNCIRKEILIEKSAIQKILTDVEIIHNNIIKQCDRIFNMYRSGVQYNVTLTDISETDELSCSIAEKIEALDTFKRTFINNHNGRKFTIDYCTFDGNLENITGCWKTSDISLALKELALILS
ncbi:uncharacterized protein LOC129971111 [Argiope bruennichi]|uniref:Uncharacterized protein n=1 Tax=Argiope bruennichi TaxID=94029 RepID=A0A8T0F9S4_ARGBR|nr:uncharacterized protein LOC129971111 [Argiope bruennichi]KAF8787028.1 hypothetical protein HNY73_008666 [Argiope bruennichi]